MPILRRVIDNTSHVIELFDTVHVGSAHENDILIENDRVPDIAAEITCHEQECIISAIQGNTILINGRKSKSHRLETGDRIEIGPAVFIFDSMEEPLPKTGTLPTAKAENILQGLTLFTEIVGKERDLHKLLQTVNEILLETIGGNDACIFKLDSSGQPQVFASSNYKIDKEHFSDTVVQQTLREGKGVFVPNALEDPAIGTARSIVDLKLTSVLCSPIKVADKIIGVIYLGAREFSQSFKEYDLAILNTYAVLVGTLINHVEYISQQRNMIRKLTEYPTYRDGIVAESRIMLDIIERIKAVADSSINILLQGETGTGKDVIAKYVHTKSSRAQKHFVVVNCSSIQKDLQESELFGHVKGSFTGAFHDHQGLFAAADGGTLFLDEIGDMDIGLQAKFLRTLETGKIRPVGSTKEHSINVRLVCATNKNLDEMVKNGEFRNDLFFRINQACFVLPPLRDREEDCIHLAYYFLEKYRAEYPNRIIVDFDDKTLMYLRRYDWPGNVRELASKVHRMVVASTTPLGTIEPDTVRSDTDTIMDFERATKEFQKNLIQKALQQCGGSKDKAANLLNIARSTFFRYIASFGL